MTLKKNKKKFSGKFLTLFLGVFLLFNITFVPKASALAPLAWGLIAGAGGVATYFGGGVVANIVIDAFKELLLSLLDVIIGLVQVAAAMFAWSTRPEYISGPTGMLNFAAVYNLWGFIRDLFNLSFIFLLLFSAFATVFQYERFSLKKNFFKIILAAVVINFSFPLTRIIIDFGNVPMYFFAQGLVGDGGSSNSLLSVPMAFFQSSNIGAVSMQPNLTSDSFFSEIISAIIFMFIFMITLFMLALLFVIRLLKLVVLLIFSPLGLAASIVPGLEDQGKKWWKMLLETVFFGPAAMLMIVIALRFSMELSSQGFISGLNATSPAANSTNQSNIIYQSIFFIPVILMWMAMQIGKNASDGASKAIMGKAEGALAWGKKQALRPTGAAWRGTKAVGRGAASPLTTRFRGLKSGLKDRFDDAKYGGNYWKNRGESAEATARGFASGGREGRQKEINKLRDKRAREQEKKWKDDGKTISEIAETLVDKDSTDIEKLAAASFLASEKEGIKDPKVLAEALKVANATTKKDLYDKILTSATDDALDMTPEEMNSVREGYKKANFKTEKRTGESDTDYADRVKKEEEKFDEALDDKFRAKFKKEGKMKVLIDYEIAENKRKGLVIPHREVYAKYMDKMKSKEIAQMKNTVDSNGKLDDQFKAYVDRKIKSGEWSIKDKQDAYAELNSKQKKAWKAEGWAP